MAGQEQGLLASIEGSNSLLDLGQKAWSSQQAGKELQQGAQGVRNETLKYGDLQTGVQKPYLAAGENALGNLQTGLANGTYGTTPYSYNLKPFDYQNSPGYQFTRQQGIGAAQAGAAAKGSLFSGTTMKALSKYGAGLAGQDYQNMFDQYVNSNQLGMQNERTSYESRNQQAQQNYGMQNELVGRGQNAANQQTNIYGNMMGNMANADIMQANARAGTIMGISNAWSQNFNNQSQIASQALGGGSGGGGQSSGGMGGQNSGGFTSMMGGQDSGGSTSMMGNDFGGSIIDAGSAYG